MPIPAEQMRAVMKMSRFACPPRLSPTVFAIGTNRTLAMVWLMNVEMIWKEENDADHQA
jgi:hypothetical protein